MTEIIDEKPRAVQQRAPLWRVAHPQTLPANIVYSIGGQLKGNEYNNIEEDLIELEEEGLDGKNKKTNGITYKADLMARLMARGMSTSDAYRSAYENHSSDALVIAQCANGVVRRHKLNAIAARYREALGDRQQQAAIPMQDFVKGRLVHEAQSAKTDAGRIKALELLGKSEGMWITVTKHERTLDPKQLQSMKDELTQRLKSAMQRLNLVASHGTGMQQDGNTQETAIPEPHREPIPLESDGSHPDPVDTNVPARSPDFLSLPVSQLGPGPVLGGSIAIPSTVHVVPSPVEDEPVPVGVPLG